MSKKHICPVCGFDGLQEAPYGEKGEPSYEVCPCCGFEFGFESQEGHASFLRKWMAGGAVWFIPGRKPQNWDLHRQLENLKEK